MTNRVRHIRHDNANTQLFLGESGEITINLGNKTAIIHDGINQGGTELARADLNNVNVATTSNAGKMSTQQVADLIQVLIDVVLNAENMELRANKIDTGLLDNIITIATEGDIKDSSYSINEVLDRVNHTGLQLMSTISDAGTLATLNRVNTNDIENNAITALQIAHQSVTTNKIQTGAVTTLEMDYDAVDNLRIQDNAVTNSKIASYTIKTNKLALLGGSSNSITLDTSEVFFPPLGFYNFVYESVVPGINIKLKINNNWYERQGGTLFWSNGTDMQLINRSFNAITIYYQKMS